MPGDVAKRGLLGELIEGFWDLLFPPRCAGCGTLGAWLCPTCTARIAIHEAAACAGCGLPLVDPSKHAECHRFTALAGLLAMAPYAPPLRPAILMFKYRFVTAIGPTLGALLAEFTKDKLPAGTLLIAPVPLHNTRLRWRGFNQSAILAREVSQRLAVPWDEGALVRARATDPQVQLEASRRHHNVRGAFRCVAPEAVRGRTVIVVDDVATTMATLEECARTLRSAGAAHVWGLVLAKD